MPTTLQNRCFKHQTELSLRLSMLLCCLYSLPVTIANKLSKLLFQASNGALNCQIAALPPTSRWMGDRICHDRRPFSEANHGGLCENLFDMLFSFLYHIVN
jgi:hypothetical protein